MGITSLTQANAAAATGLVLVTTSTFSAASSVSVDNCFSASYQNYSVSVNLQASAAAALRWRWRAGGSDFTTAEYNNQGMRYNSVGFLNEDDVGYGTLCDVEGSYPALVWVYPSDPYAVNKSRLFATAVTGVSGTGYNLPAMSGSGLKTTSRSEDGFTIYPSTGTITGTLRVYGYRNTA